MIFRAVLGSLVLAMPVFLEQAPARMRCVSVTNFAGVSMHCVEQTGHGFEKNRPMLGSPAAYPRTERKHEVACIDEQQVGETARCASASACTTADGAPGVMHRVLERRVFGPNDAGSWSIRSWSCLASEGTGDRVPQAKVEAAFRTVAWPRARLSLMPEGGRTLVNRTTVAFAEDPGTISRRAVAGGRDAEFEGTAIAWTWHWGDGTSVTTDHPGAPWPDASVSHRYVRAAKGLEVRVDVTYAGRARPVGEGWRDVSERLTVRGESQRLDVVQAVPHLVR